VTPASDRIAQAHQSRLEAVNTTLEAVLPPANSEPRRLHEAMRHGVFGGGGGKRLRPVILLTVAADLGVDRRAALAPAVALELVHSYSLVHDDLPCMDDASTRRGAASVHAAYGCADAVLAGDALLTLAFEVLGRMDQPAAAACLTVELARAAGTWGMLGGQHADLDESGRVAAALPGDDHPTLKIARLKTARLFGFAFSAASHLDGRHAADASVLRAVGEDFGTAFQVADDLSDADEDDRAPNFARAVGREPALETARRALGRCTRLASEHLGPSSETVAYIETLAARLGL